MKENVTICTDVAPITDRPVYPLVIPDPVHVKPEPCSVDNICPALDSRIEGANFETSKGFCTIHLVNTTTGTTRFFGVAYKERKADKGVMLNYCPFCGQHPGEFKG